MICYRCGKTLGDHDLFCSACGTKQTTTYKMTFTRGIEQEKEFIEQINYWFASNPCAANIKCRFDLEQGFGFFANRYVLRSFEIEYELFSTACSNSYYLFSEEVSSLHRMSVRKYVEDWKAVNPAASVVNWSGGTNARGNIGALCIGFGAANHLNVFMLVKYPREASPAAYGNPACAQA